MDTKINYKVGVVFAASKGLGKACALSQTREGCRVAIYLRDNINIEFAAREIKSETGGEIHSYVVDVENVESIATFIVQMVWNA